MFFASSGFAVQNFVDKTLRDLRYIPHHVRFVPHVDSASETELREQTEDGGPWWWFSKFAVKFSEKHGSQPHPCWGRAAATWGK